jgi:uncharacterized protein
MERLLVWRGLDAWRAESTFVQTEGDRLTAHGTQLGLGPYRLDYQLRTGPEFVTESVELSLLHAGGLRRLRLVRAADGTWTADDRSLPELDDALDCDVLASPIFNTMPVLRHGMVAGGEPRNLVMAFVTVPDLVVTRSEQRYTPLGEGRVNYASGDFSADIHLDADGLVTLYEGYIERV